ncbi:SNF2 family N-terminal domain-containing protein [Dipodascopsis tothii]|uniref:SNF2 family N-terminal domain-containing protein n=1 Tax=Dipodascopsis tothii TaxID=44089 RepID=UPI0034CFB47A
MFNNYRTAGQTEEELEKLLENIRADEEISAEDRVGTPDELCVNLLEHQKLGLSWLKSMEESTKGGILADDMGLGKTVQSIALILSQRAEDDKCKTTLIVAPVALIRQWERELHSKVKPEHRLAVYVYHGTARRAVRFQDLAKYDVVITTYGTISREFKENQELAVERANPNGAPARAPKGASVFYAADAAWYRVVLDEAQFIKNKDTLNAKAMTHLKAQYRWCLSGTPMQNGVNELYSLIRFLNIRPYCDERRFQFDIGRPLKSTGADAVESAMKKLRALLKAIMLRRTKKSLIDGKPILQLPPKHIEIVHTVFSDEEKAFYKQLEQGAMSQMNKFLSEGSIGRNYSSVLTMLLRLRQACCHPKLIPDRSMTATYGKAGDAAARALARVFPEPVIERVREAGPAECPVCYDTAEDDQSMVLVYPCGHNFCRDCLDDLANRHQAASIAQGSDGGRLLCPTCRGPLNMERLVDYASFRAVFDVTEGAGGAGAAAAAADSDDEAVESDSIDDSDGRGKGKGRARLYASKAEAAGARKRRNGEYDAILAELRRDWVSSAKVTRCVEILRDVEANYPDEKVIVFSQFTSLLDFVEIPLRQLCAYQVQRYDGSMSANARNDAILRFTEDPACKIMLVSLKAGNVGLNLTVASHCIILDPFWNPFVEDQAIDRAYRIGQTRRVAVHRIVISDSVEDRILQLQDKKRKLIEAAMDEKELKDIGRLNSQELAYLFGIQR